MEELYYVSLSTGALVQGIYSSLDKAKEAVVKHYRLMADSGNPEYIDHMVQNMEWVETVHNEWAWVPVIWDRNRNVHGQNKTLDGRLEDVTITVIELDRRLPIV